MWKHLVLVALFLFVPYSAMSEEATILTLSANGTRNTRPFTVKDHWEIRWTIPDGMLAVTVYRSNPKNDLERIPVASGSQMKPGPGATYVETGGQYYLNIVSPGDWTITVVQLP
jgi:hypothetical protein